MLWGLSSEVSEALSTPYQAETASVWNFTWQFRIGLTVPQVHACQSDDPLNPSRGDQLMFDLGRAHMDGLGTANYIMNIKSQLF